MPRKSPPAERARPAGYWLDESVPDLSALLTPARIDPKEFSAWLGPLLGKYRETLADEALLPPRSRNRDAARELAQHLTTTLDRLAPGRLPPETEAEMRLEVHRAQADWHALTDRVRADLTLLQVAAQRVALKLDKQPPQQRGRKRTTARDALLAQVIDRIRASPVSMRADDVRALASRVLEACRVVTPESGDDETLRKAAARARRRTGKK